MMMSSGIEESIAMEKEIQILHLEDDAKDAELIQTMLDSAGVSCQVTCVQSASEFSEALSKRQYELILADYRLPAYDGISALRFSRENYPDIPFIFVSGTLGEDAAIDGLTQGATDYVLKNKLARLVPAVKRALNEAENRKKRKEAEEALRKNNVLLERIFSTTEFMLAYLDADFNFIRVNRAFAEVSEEKNPEFFEGKNYFEQYPDPENEVIFRRVIDTGEPYVAYAKPFEDAAHPERGTTYWNWGLQPVKDENGRVNGLVLSLIDVTERERAYITLRQREEQLRLQSAALEAAANGFIITDRDGKIIWVNPAFTHLTGYSMEEVVGGKPSVLKSGKQDQSFYKNLWDTILSGQIWHGELVNRRKDGHLYTEEMTIAPLQAEGGEISHFIAVKQDITERRQMEEALRASEERLKLALDAAEMSQWEWNIMTGEIVWSQQCLALYGLPPDTLMSYERFLQALHPEDRERVDAALGRAVDERTNYDEMKRTIWPDGTIHWTASRGQVYCDAAGEPIRMVGVTFDISKWKEAEEEHQVHLRFLESMDRVNRAIQGTNNLEQMMSDALDIVLSIFDCDRAFLLYPCDPEAPSWYAPMERTHPEYPGVLALGIDEIPMDAEVARTFHIMLEADGPVKFGPGASNALPRDISERFDIKSFMSMALYPKVSRPWQFGIHQCSYERIWTPEEERLFQEIGRRLSDALSTLLAYRNLQESEERYRQLVDMSPDAIVIYSQGNVVFVNPATVLLSGAKSEEDLVGRPILDFIHPEYQDYVKKSLEQMQRTGESTPFVEEKFLRVDGSNLDVEAAVVPYRFQNEDYVQIVARDITERKQHEREREAIITVSTALRQARTRTEILNVILDQLVDLFDADGSVLVLPDPQTGGLINEMGSGIIGERMVGLKIPSGKGVGNWVITKEKPYLNNVADQDPLFYRPDLLRDSHCLVAAPLIAQEQAIGALLVARQVDFDDQDLRLLTAIADIAANAVHRVTLHEQTEQQLHRLIALHQIDLAISTNFDLNITLNVILANVKEELEVDAASILLLNPVTHTLNYAAGIGFRTHNIEGSRVKLENGCAGRAAQEQRTVSSLELGQARETLSRFSFLSGEDFTSHYATPLVVKGQVKGVLEIFHRASIEPEHTWLGYFETLATQAAIAIDNTFLFESLQRSNMELTLAYDATIEGWSRALDLRDRETEGHTQRVAEMALGLAEKIGMSDVEKLDLRRGALLHDIGKMGIPDAILLKPAPLSDEEWEIMRRHPLYAYQMLAPIAYLKRALEIPYCHHEKWDGSGYPRGLKGEEIPLSARVFAIVDVFDALISDRPYSKPWSREQAYRYIQEQAGKHFDPQIVEVFLEAHV
jgi:PAS domain S-box-containing protein